MPYSSTFLVSNIHCPSCVTHAKDVLRAVPGLHDVDVSLLDHTVRVQHDERNAHQQIVTELINAAFEIRHVAVSDSQGAPIHEYEANLGSRSSPVSTRILGMSRVHQKHIENCQACQNERLHQAAKPKLWQGSSHGLQTDTNSEKAMLKQVGSNSSQQLTKTQSPTIDLKDPHEEEEKQTYVAALSISGASASCRDRIEAKLQSMQFVATAEVDVAGASARVVYQGSRDSYKTFLEGIRHLGFEAAMRTIEPVNSPNVCQNQVPSKLQVSIEGMTCSSCVSAITGGLQELPFVNHVNIDLLGNSGAITITDRSKVEDVLNKIEDLGYGAKVVNVEDVDIGQDSMGAKERTLQIKVEGMFCNHCPDNIVSAIRSALPPPSTCDAMFTITGFPSLKSPVITISYVPLPPLLTVRTFVSTINASNEAFRACVYYPPSLEERSRDVQRKELRYLLWRLLFTTVVAIPSFIIGIVFMSLVPASNPTRQWFEEPIIVGNAMRMEWALFFMTTPVMLFGADVFHRRAVKEIYSLWRPSSRASLCRRFFRFGSMNLLISAGTSIAYFSSLLVLGMDAASKPVAMDAHRSSDTYFDTVTFLTFFLLIGRFLEAYSKAKTGDAVAMLSNLRPSEALLVESRMTQRVPVNQLEIGDVVQISHGSSPPTDGVIDQTGVFIFDESSLTGESKPIKKHFGDTVYAGSVNISDAVKTKITAVEGASMLDRIVSIVREGRAKRAPIERIADTITGHFVPVITLIAILTWSVWLSLGLSGHLPPSWLDVPQGGWPFWSLEFAIAVFVVACPCGIGLAAPTALFVGGGLAAKAGILVQGGGEAFQEASKIDAMVFDKTGTLTQGKMQVIDFQILENHLGDGIQADAKLAMAVARRLEEACSHPIAKAIVDRASQETDEANVDVFEHEEIPGRGMKGDFALPNSGASYFEAAIGSEEHFRSLSHSRQGNEATPSGASRDGTTKNSPGGSDYYLSRIVQRYQSSGHSIAILAMRRKPSGLEEQAISPNNPFRPIAVFAVSDPIRPEAPFVLRSLEASGLQVYMCTGDNATTALAVASQLGIKVSNVCAGVLPQEKAVYIQRLQRDLGPEGSRSRKIIAFVGDGTNDTPALSMADVSIALSSGSDIAVTTASFILLNPDLTTVLNLVRLARRVFLRVKLNFAWAAVYNLCLVPVAAGVFFAVGATPEHGGWRLGPVWASVAMACSSVSVVLSSLALKLPEVKFRRRWLP